MRFTDLTETSEEQGLDYQNEKRELELYIMNDADLYRQMFMPIISGRVAKN